MQRVFIVEHFFRMLSYEAVKKAHQVHFPDAAIQNTLRKSTAPLSAEFIGICRNGFSYSATEWGKLQHMSQLCNYNRHSNLGCMNFRKSCIMTRIDTIVIKRRE
jgi:hypothetical protein